MKYPILIRAYIKNEYFRVAKDLLANACFQTLLDEFFPIINPCSKHE